MLDSLRKKLKKGKEKFYLKNRLYKMSTNQTFLRQMKKKLKSRK